MGLLRRYVFHDIGLKLFSLVMAICLWAAVTQDHAAVVPWNGAIELHNMPQPLEVSSVSLPQARLWLSGPSRRLDRLRPNDVHVGIDLSNAQPGEHTYSLTSTNVQLPDAVHVKQIDPAQVQIRL